MRPKTTRAVWKVGNIQTICMHEYIWYAPNDVFSFLSVDVKSSPCRTEVSLLAFCGEKGRKVESKSWKLYECIFCYVVKYLLRKTCFRFYLSTCLSCLILVSIGVWLWWGRKPFLPFSEDLGRYAPVTAASPLSVRPSRDDHRASLTFSDTFNQSSIGGLIVETRFYPPVKNETKMTR